MVTRASSLGRLHETDQKTCAQHSCRYLGQVFESVPRCAPPASRQRLKRHAVRRHFPATTERTRRCCGSGRRFERTASAKRESESLTRTFLKRASFRLSLVLSSSSDDEYPTSAELISLLCTHGTTVPRKSSQCKRTRKTRGTVHIFAPKQNVVLRAKHTQHAGEVPQNSWLGPSARSVRLSPRRFSRKLNKERKKKELALCWWRHLEATFNTYNG